MPIVLDPGYGFGKRFGENYALLARQAELLALGCPLLAGVSRKSFLGHTLAPLHEAVPPPSMLAKTPASPPWSPRSCTAPPSCACTTVRPAVEAARIADAILDAR